MALKVWLPLNGDLHNQGLSKITVTNNGATVDNNGKIGKCYSFSGNNQMTLNSHPASGKAAITVACWCYPKSESLIGLFGFANNPTYEFSMSHTNEVQIVYRDTANSNAVTWDFTDNPITTNVWQHWVFVYDHGKLFSYKNGILEKSYEGTSAALRTMNESYIGRCPTSTAAKTFNGKINDFRIYDHALSPKEVKELSKGLVLHYKLDDLHENNLLPKGIELYDYIESTGTQYIDIDYNVPSTYKIEMKGQYTQLPNNVWQLFGYHAGNQAIQFGISNTNKWVLRFGTSNDVFGTTADTNLHTFVIKPISTGAEFYIDDTLITTNNSSAFTTTAHFLIFRRYFSSTGNDCYDLFKLYYFKVWDDDGTLIRNMLPCTFLGEPGMWDTVENKFYRNKGTGQFTLGNKITLREYEYLESTGTQWIDTGTKFNAESDSCTVIFKGNASHAGMIFASSGAKYFWLYYYNNQGIRIYADNGSGQESVPGYIARDENKHTMKWENKHYIIDDVDKGTLTKTYTETTNNIWLFAWGGGGGNYPFKGRIYYTNIKHNNQLVRDFIPASYNGTPGLWDKVEWKFYANAGTGSFTLGPEVSFNKIYDCSGFGNHGTISGTLSLNNDSPRYGKSLKNTTEYPCRTSTTINFPQSSGLTISCWVNLTTWGTSISGLWATSNNSTGPDDHTTTACNHYDQMFLMNGTNGNNYSLTCNTSNVPLNTWKHVVLTHDGTNARFYINGELIQTRSVPTSLVAFNYIFLGYSKAGGVHRKCQGSWSDFRVYCTALSADDIKDLYDTPTFIDNQGDLLTCEFVEDDEILVDKTGITSAKQFKEDGTETQFYNTKLIQSTQILEI